MKNANMTAMAVRVYGEIAVVLGTAIDKIISDRRHNATLHGHIINAQEILAALNSAGLVVVRAEDVEQSIECLHECYVEWKLNAESEPDEPLASWEEIDAVGESRDSLRAALTDQSGGDHE